MLQIGRVRANEVDMYVNSLRANFSVRVKECFGRLDMGRKRCSIRDESGTFTNRFHQAHKPTCPPIHEAPDHKTDQTACIYISIDKLSIHGKSTANHGPSSATIRVPYIATELPEKCYASKTITSARAMSFQWRPSFGRRGG